MNDEARVQPGSVVTLHFSLSLEDGTVAETTADGEPMRFTVGDGSMIRGLEMALYGMTTGEKRNVRIGPDLGFGDRDPEAVQEMPRSDFPQEMDLRPGLIIAFETPQGDEVPGAVTVVRNETVTVDLNHPLAGHELLFAYEILEVEPPP